MTTADSILPDTYAPDAPLLPPQIVQQQPLLRVRGLMKRYGTVSAVDGVDVVAYAGEVLGIVGESGSGKSTVLRLLNLEMRGYITSKPLGLLSVIFLIWTAPSAAMCARSTSESCISIRTWDCACATPAAATSRSG